jgi:nucleoside phosphorylase
MNNSPTPLQRTAIVLTAIQSETEAVLRHLTEQGRERVADTWFHTGRFASWTVAIAEVGPGNTRAATVAVRALSHFRPEIAAFVGIAGGVKDVALGDVVVATKVYNYESGKDTAGGFSVRPDLQNSDHELEQRARVLRTSTTWHDRLDASLWPDHKPNVHVGPIAAGEAVVASRKSRIAAHIKTYYGDALAVEMEGRGFLEAAHVDSGCRAVVVRGISDRLAGKATSDRRGWQQRAADSAATFFFEMLALEAGSAQLHETYSKQAAQSSSPQPQPFPNAQPKDGPARFRSPGEALGIRDGAGFIDAGAGNSIYLTPGPAIWLRLMPPFDPGKKWTSVELRAALNQGINLPTLIGPANGTYTIRSHDGVGTCIINSAAEQETDYVAFVFESGEVWAISTYPLRTHPQNIFVAEIEKLVTDGLRGYVQFLTTLGVQPPYKWIAGVTGVKGRELQYPVAPGQMRIPGWGSHKCVSEHIVREGSYDRKQSPASVLLAFFNDIYNKCGIARPDHLPQ